MDLAYIEFAGEGQCAGGLEARSARPIARLPGAEMGELSKARIGFDLTECPRRLIRERTKAGLDAAAARGRGRPPVITPENQTGERVGRLLD